MVRNFQANFLYCVWKNVSKCFTFLQKNFYQSSTSSLNGDLFHSYIGCFVCFVPSLSSCHEKTTVALCVGWIRTRLRVVHFQVFRLFLRLYTTNLLLVWSHQAKIIIVKRLQRVRWGWELNLDCDRDHTVAVKSAL